MLQSGIQLEELLFLSLDDAQRIKLNALNNALLVRNKRCYNDGHQSEQSYQTNIIAVLSESLEMGLQEPIIALTKKGVGYLRTGSQILDDRALTFVMQFQFVGQSRASL